MQNWFIHVIYNVRADLQKSFDNEDLTNTIFRYLSQSWQSKITGICESKDLPFMSLAILIGKLLEHELDLNRLVESQKGEKKKKSFALKVKDQWNNFLQSRLLQVW